MPVTNAEIIDAIRRWQSHPYHPPMTCQTDSRHGKLVPNEEDGTIVLRCPTCPYLERVIPEAVLQDSGDRR